MLATFLKTHWPSWRDEVRCAYGNDPVSLHLASIGAQVIGFAAYHGNNVGTGWFGPMGTDPAYRGRGIGGQILGELEGWAAELGFARAILETALKQPEAIGLYRKHGYRQIENYGPYVTQPKSVCFEKPLDDKGHS